MATRPDVFRARERRVIKLCGNVADPPKSRLRVLVLRNQNRYVKDKKQNEKQKCER